MLRVAFDVWINMLLYFIKGSSQPTKVNNVPLTEEEKKKKKEDYKEKMNERRIEKLLQQQKV